MLVFNPLILVRKKMKAVNDAANARYIGPSKDEPGMSWTIIKAIRGPIKDDREMDEFNNPAAVALSLLRSSIILREPT